LRKSDGRFMLRESAMCPDEDKAAFEDISKHKFFNTNNLWINLPRLKSVLDAVSRAGLDHCLKACKRYITPVQPLDADEIK
jgi:UTP--glucose-1-phosphate uridylyltransferase